MPHILGTLFFVVVICCLSTQQNLPQPHCLKWNKLGMHQSQGLWPCFSLCFPSGHLLGQFQHLQVFPGRVPLTTKHNIAIGYHSFLKIFYRYFQMLLTIFPVAHNTSHLTMFYLSYLLLLFLLYFSIFKCKFNKLLRNYWFLLLPFKCVFISTQNSIYSKLGTQEKAFNRVTVIALK